MIIGIILTLGLVALDLYTKNLAALYLKGRSVTVIPGILGLTYSENTGMAFSMLTGKTVLLACVTALALLGLVWLIFIKKYGTKTERFFLLLVLAGGIGNLISRVFQGYVIDFFEFLFINFAIFNVADVYVCTGVGLYIAYTLYDELARKEK